MSVEAKVKPELLEWARKSSGLDLPTASKKIGVNLDRLEGWEKGKSRPTIIQLRKAAEVYKRPLAVFYLQKPPQDVAVLHDFRRLSTEKHPYSPELRYEIRRAQHRRKIALELYETLEEQPIAVSLKASIKDEPEKVATRIRDFLGITVAHQLSWSNEYDAFNSWKSLVENKNILVFQASRISIAEMRGFSVSAEPLPAIVLNIKDSPLARIFTLIHELTHIIIGKEGVCDFHDDSSGIEVFCNAVAGATLVPQLTFLDTTEIKDHKHNATWSDEEIRTLSLRFKVSRQVILRRLLTLGLITNRAFNSKQQQYEEQAKLASSKPTEGFVPPPTLAVATAGKLFSRLVLTSYQREKITGAEVSDLLSVRLKHLPTIESAIFT